VYFIIVYGVIPLEPNRERGMGILHEGTFIK